MVIIDEKRCTGCGACVADCIQGNLRIEEGRAVVSGDCFSCGHCVAVCPQGAPSIPNYPATCVEYCPETFDLPTENILNTIKFRRSIRDFEDRPLSMEDLHILMDAASHMPTAKNSQSCRFVFIQDSLDAFKELIWSEVAACAESAAGASADAPLDADTARRFLAQKQAEEPVDYLFRNAPAVLCIESVDPLDTGLAAAAIELVGTTRGIGVLYDGYLRRLITASEDARVYTDSSTDKPLRACLLVGYQKTHYFRTAPRRNPSVVLR